MAASIKASMGVDGASKFRTELRNAKTAVKELDSELKLAESQFKVTGDQEQYMSDKTSLLKDQIEAQEKVVKLLKDQLHNAAAKYGDNSEQVSKLKTELNKAKTQQNNLKDALNNVQTPLKDAGTETGTLAEKAGEAATSTGTLDENLQNVAAHLDLEAVANFANNVAGAIENAAKKAKDLAIQVWNLGANAGTTADEWLTMSTQYGISVEDLQKWSYAGRFVDTTLDNITGSMVRFRTKFGDVREAFDELSALQNRRANTKNKTEIEQLDKQIASLSEKALALKNNFGIDIYDAQHNLRSTADIYWEMIDVIGNAYNNGNQELAEQAAMDWFGRSAANLNPLFKAGKDAFMELGEEAQQMGYIMSEEDVVALGEFDDQNQKLQASIDALQLSLAKELLPLLTPISEGFTKISDSMLEWLQSEEGKKAISDLSSAIGDVFDSMSGDIPEAVKSATTLVTNFAQGFSDAETAVNKVITAVETLAAIWAASKLVSFGASMVSASQSIGNFFGKLFAGLGSKGATTATAAGAGAGTATATAKGGGILAKLLGSTGAKILGGVGAGTYTLLKPLINQFEEAGEREEAAQKVVDGDIEVAQRATELGHTLAEAESYIAGNMHEWGISAEDAKAMYLQGGDGSDTPALANPEKKAQETKTLAYETEVYADALKRLDAAMQDLIAGNGDFWLRESVEELKGADIENIFSQDVINGLLDYDSIEPSNFAAWSKALREQLAVAAGEATSGLSEGMQEGASVSDMKKTGEYAIAGFTSGILSGETNVRNAARHVALAARLGVKDALQIASPSKVMEQMGVFTAEGFAQGITSGSGQVAGAVDRMLGVINRSPIYNSTGRNDTESGTESFIAALNGAQVVMDGERVGQLIFPYINTEAGKAMQRRYA